MSEKPREPTDTEADQPKADPVPGTPEHDQKMVDLANSRSGDAPDKEVEPTDTTPAPDAFQLQDENGLYLGKYKTVEDLAKAHKGLESKLGAPKPEADPASTTDLPPKTDAEKAGEEGEPAAEPELKTVMADFGQKYAENGSFSDEDYAALEAKGFDRATVSVYEAGLASLNQGRIDAAVEACGSEEKFNQVRQWAGESLSEAEYNAFSKQLSNAETAEDIGAIYGTLSTRFNASAGEAGLLGDKLPAGDSSASGFSSRQEQSAAVNDPRYKTDPAYRKDVAARIAASKF